MGWGLVKGTGRLCLVLGLGYWIRGFLNGVKVCFRKRLQIGCFDAS